jgi:hypothetical protein
MVQTSEVRIDLARQEWRGGSRHYWVTEWYVRASGEDYTFYSVGTQHLLTDPRPVEKMYPWNDGDRPLTMGYGSLESHKIFPMSPAESWQPLQSEINDLGNLTLDTVKMNISPIAKVKRGRSVDLEKLRTRGPGTNMLMTDVTDVEFEKPPGVDAGAWAQMERLNNDFDTLSGQFDAGSVQSNRKLNETVGGMKLINGQANAIGEFDQRLIIETWTEPSIGQIVKLCQYYEHDETILALCGQKAALWEKFGVNEITDKMLDAQATVRIDVGVGAGDPQQRLAKFAGAATIVGPIIEHDPRFVTGELKLDIFAIFDEVFGSAGYRDGGKRFLKEGQPAQPPPDPKVQTEQLKQQTMQQKAQSDQETARVKADALVQELQGKMVLMQKTIEMKELELQLKQREMALREREMQSEAFHADRQRNMEAQAADRQANLDERTADREFETSQRNADLTQEAGEHKFDLTKKTTEFKAKQAMKPKPAAKPKR